jgi:hypothetical protein
MHIRPLLAACAALLLGLVPLGMADIPSPPPQGIRVPMRIVEGSGYAVLEIPRGVLRDLASAGGLRAADVAPPPNIGNPITQIAGGALLALGAFFLGQRVLRRRRNGGASKSGKLVPLAMFILASLSLLSHRVEAQPARGDYNSGTLARAIAGGPLEGTVAIRVSESGKDIVLLLGGDRNGARRSRPRPPGSAK